MGPCFSFDVIRPAQMREHLHSHEPNDLCLQSANFAIKLQVSFFENNAKFITQYGRLKFQSVANVVLNGWSRLQQRSTIWLRLSLTYSKKQLPIYTVYKGDLRPSILIETPNPTIGIVHFQLFVFRMTPQTLLEVTC
jgi:hypothetical protein